MPVPLLLQDPPRTRESPKDSITTSSATDIKPHLTPRHRIRHPTFLNLTLSAQENPPHPNPTPLQSPRTALTDAQCSVYTVGSVVLESIEVRNAYELVSRHAAESSEEVQELEPGSGKREREGFSNRHSRGSYRCLHSKSGRHWLGL
jgi:hypothetical protein